MVVSGGQYSSILSPWMTVLNLQGELADPYFLERYINIAIDQLFYYYKYNKQSQNHKVI